MTDDLRKLIEAVEAGHYVPQKSLPFEDPCGHVLAAMDGSIDAAVAMLEALLPGWEWEINSAGQVARVFRDGLMDDTSIWAVNPILSRALLLAVLEAKLVEMEDE